MTFSPTETKSNTRNPYLITRALRTFLWASVLAAVASQIATITDAIVVSNLIGPDAISAVNLVMPVVMVFMCIAILFGIGSSIVAARAIGRRDNEAANGIFTVGIILTFIVSVLVAAVTYFAAPQITALLGGGESEIEAYATIYLQVICIGTPGMMVSMTLQNFVKTDGNPRIVMYAVAAGSVINLALDIIFVKFLGMGIAGPAWATAINYVVAIGICMLHFKKSAGSLRWKIYRDKIGSFTGQSVKQGFPMSINTLMLSVCIFVINTIVIQSLGGDGMYVWSVCLQLFLIMQMVLTGVGSSIYAIGGVLSGEGDMAGLKILNMKTALYMALSLGGFMVLILIFPGWFGSLFGSGEGASVPMLDNALRIYSLLLVPYSMGAVLRSTYQILGRFMLSLVLSVGQLVLMVAGVWIFSAIGKELLWWGFPASGVLLLLLDYIYTLKVHSANPRLRIMTLIPKEEDVPALNISVKMDRSDVKEALKTIDEFLKTNRIDDSTAYNVKLSCEELMYNIVAYAIAKKPEHHYFDIHIRCYDNRVDVLIKDDGRPFNPVAPREEGYEPGSEEHLGLRLVSGVSSRAVYKYMYDQNMVTLSFDLPQEQVLPVRG